MQKNIQNPAGTQDETRFGNHGHELRQSYPVLGGFNPFEKY